MAAARDGAGLLVSGLTLQPSFLAVEGCAGLPQAHAFQLINNTGAAGTFDLSYLVSGGDGTLTGPAQISLASGQVADFEVVLAPGLCVTPGSEIYARLEAAGNGSTSLAQILQIVHVDPRWETATPHPLACLNWLVETAVDPGDDQEYVYVAGCDTHSTYRYDPRLDAWRTLAGALPGILSQAGDGAVYGGRIFTRGDGQEDTSQLYIYHIQSDAWSSQEVPGEIQDRALYDAVELEGQIYFLGGWNPRTGQFSSEVDRYDPQTGEWLRVASLLHARALAMAWVYLDKIYVAGGLNAGGALSSTEVYDPSTGTWTQNPASFAPLPAPRYGAGDAVLDEQLWLVGGFDTDYSDDTLFWSAAGNSWHSGPTLPSAAAHLEATALAGHLYAVGGTQGGDTRLDDNQHLVVCPDRTGCEGWLQGRVYDAELPLYPPPCAPASLNLTPGGSIAADPITGRYGPLPLLPGAYLLEAGTTGYSLEYANVTVEHAITVTQDVGLWRATVAAAPARIDAVLNPGASLATPLWITNTGHLPLEYQLLELGPTRSGDVLAPGDGLPWLWTSPAAGEIAPSQSAAVELTLSCSSVQGAQRFTGTLALLHTDPCLPTIEVPVDLGCKGYVYLPLAFMDAGPLLSPSGPDRPAAPR